jgi:uncharacterized protein (TIGR02588 family)
MAREAARGRRRKPAPATPLLEWIGAAAGSLAALTLIGSLATEALTQSDTPPQLSVAALAEYRQPSATGEPSRVIPFRVTNEGGRTAAEVLVVARAQGTDGEAVETEIVFDFVPRGSERDGAIVLPGEPGGATPTFRVAGYREP